MSGQRLSYIQLFTFLILLRDNQATAILTPAMIHRSIFLIKADEIAMTIRP